jgi:hypothetical protein
MLCYGPVSLHHVLDFHTTSPSGLDLRLRLRLRLDQPIRYVSLFAHCQQAHVSLPVSVFY